MFKLLSIFVEMKVPHSLNQSELAIKYRIMNEWVSGWVGWGCMC